MIRFGAGRAIAGVDAGIRCGECGEAFDDSDEGLLQPVEGAAPLALHEDCFIRLIAGGVNHQRGRCRCCGGTEPPDPPSLTRHEAARVAAHHWRLRQ